MSRYLFIGAVEYSELCLRAMLESGVNVVSIMCPVQESARFNSDYTDLGGVAKEFGNEVRYFGKIKDEVEYIKEKAPDFIFVFGLSQIISRQILDIPTVGSIGSHPALLPKNRGRHPLIWAIANGLTESGITFLWLDEGVDTGDIWVQESFEIGETEDAAAVYSKVGALSVRLLKEHLPRLEAKEYSRTPQDDRLSNTWRKRGKSDGKIDWRMGSRRIYNLVRALAKPYVGAHCRYLDGDVKVWKVVISIETELYVNIEPGKVLFSQEGRISIKTGDGVIDVIEHDFEKLPEAGEYL